ncbi:bifunctional 2-polyprenyl-6-hydroxyphenol methylase/3-demethylubiquinol 3-O-methyltransferase UbiG [Paenalcaligenes faecalis]|uniref:bifunctional 2-polyprenyl-6-hydroxyphenol methylase/3-demethylubiquinol 3-O-methyltransferase UbiG n=1 Tax=Paenalcaligenes faecalis TaxID=2980099 RepID=UPI0022B9C035|nr:bifunctional 2-polyprenyl-6-hydroxyphenol methylase/3-demethylubiquinol 3-O-methyltransferase UbiG [Paenalcaligenes faecalis]
MSTVNVDPAEIEKFSALASRWWDPTSEFKPLHEINPLRLDWISQTAGGLQNKKIIDVGCGGGILTESMAAKGADVTGIDLAEKSLKIARLHSLESGVKVKYEHISAESMAAEHIEAFDVVTCMEMLEHVPDPASIIRACSQMVKSGGWVFFSTLNRNPKSFLYAIVGAEYLLNLVPKGTHHYETFIKPSELARSARQSGLVMHELKGLEYHPLTKHYTLSQNSSVNYLMATQKPKAKSEPHD